MITAQDIREKTFDKTTFGGYDMSGVDDYLEELAADVTSTQKEIATLRAKMKVLVDKIEEYRANESAMNKAILAAQKLASSIEAEANEKAAAVLADANARAEAILADAEEQRRAITADLSSVREMEERRLEAAREASTAYFEKAFSNLDRQKDFLCALANVSSAPEEKPEEAPAPAAEEIVEEPVPAAEIPAEAPVYEDEVDEPTRMFRF